LLLSSAEEKERLLTRLKVLVSKQESKNLSTEILNKLPAFIGYKSVDSSSTVKTVEQLRIKTIEQESWSKLAELSSIRPTIQRKAPIGAESKTTRINTKNRTQQDWNW
jgi:hypothetical protein